MKSLSRISHLYGLSLMSQLGEVPMDGDVCSQSGTPEALFCLIHRCQFANVLKFRKIMLDAPFQRLTVCKTYLQKWSPEMATYGYARVSTAGQDLSAQIEALKAAGATTIFREKISGVKANRPQLAKAMAALTAGDTLLVCKLDRLGRSTRELLELIDRIGKAGAAFRSLGDPLWDTSSSQGRLLSTLLAGIAAFERDLICERTGEGRKRALANGVKFGRKRKLSKEQRAEALKRRDAGDTLASIAMTYGVSLAMISRL
ncbi:MAG: recombinase family protein [Xanthobacteraceae bacterium]